MLGNCHEGGQFGKLETGRRSLLNPNSLFPLFGIIKMVPRSHFKAKGGNLSITPW
jgi:hypothetical protein